jgi:hypothetical protein
MAQQQHQREYPDQTGNEYHAPLRRAQDDFATAGLVGRVGRRGGCGVASRTILMSSAG